jgi:hypothetical protein
VPQLINISSFLCPTFESNAAHGYNNNMFLLGMSFADVVVSLSLA